MSLNTLNMISNTLAKRATLSFLMAVFYCFTPSKSIAADGEPAITREPAMQIALIGGSAVFDVQATGGSPLMFQWWKNYSAILSATNASVTVSNISSGDNNSVFFVVVSNQYGSATSQVATLIVDPGVLVTNTVTLVPMNATWRYNTNNTDPGTDWKNPGFPDGSWAVGSGVLDVHTNNRSTVAGQIVGTRLPLKDASGNPMISTYFRTTFSLTNPFIVSVSLKASALINDGAAIYVNGAEATRMRLESWATYNTWASTDAGTPAIEQFNLSGTNLVFGDNVIAAEVHQVASTSPDITWGLKLEASIVTRVSPVTPPVVISTYPSPGMTVNSVGEVEVFFNEPVMGVDAADLLMNGIPATNVYMATESQYVFEFAPPSAGTVQMTWSPSHQITDRSVARNAFSGTSWSYLYDTNTAQPRLLINEFLASNKRGIHDEDGTTSDWIEIFNPSSVAVNLQGWYLSASVANPTQWCFPSVTIQSNGYLLIWASGKDRTNASGPLHANFTINKDGGFLALIRPNGSVIESGFTNYPAQQTDVSYGRDRIEPDLVGFFTSPTPLAPNSTTGAGYGSEVNFSRNSGTFLSPFDLVLATDNTNAVIRFEFGTNQPTSSSMIYTNPIRITNTVRIRARSFIAGYLPGPTQTKDYIYLDTAGSYLGFNLANFGTKLPIVVFHNYGAGALPATRVGIDMMMQVFEPQNGRSSVTNQPNLAVQGTFHRRGKSTFSNPRPNLSVSIIDEFGDGKDVSLVGLPEESSWVFYGPSQYDKSMLHNALAHDLYRQMGYYSSRTRFVEVYLKDDAGTPGALTASDYMGIYLVEEKIKISPNRVDIDKLAAENTNSPSVTGGYLMSYDVSSTDSLMVAAAGYTTTSGSGINLLNPGLEIAPAQKNYITNYLNAFYSALTSANWTNPVTGYTPYIDLPNWIDCHMNNAFLFNVDALRLSCYFYKPRNGPLTQGPLWDFDRSSATYSGGDGRGFNPRLWRSGNGDGGTDFFNAASAAGFNNLWYGKMFTDPDFFQKWIDRYAELRKSVYSVSNIHAVIDYYANEIREAAPRDATRWAGQTMSDTTPRVGAVTADGYTYTFPSGASYQNEVDCLKSWFTNRVHFMDTNFLRAPVFSMDGGSVTSLFNLILTSTTLVTNSTIYYTLDGTDPRLPGGGLSPKAFSNVNSATLTITNNARVFARCFNKNHSNRTGASQLAISSSWSPPTVATFVVTPPALRITEIMFHPPAPALGDTNDVNNFEYIELANVGSNTLSLAGFQVSQAVSYTFTTNSAVTSLAPGARVLIVKNLSSFYSRYPSLMYLVAGEYAGSLNNGGDRIVLQGPLGEVIHDFTYDNAWQPLSDGPGFSLTVVDENAASSAWTNSSQWRASSTDYGTPGSPDVAATVVTTPVIINEILAHPPTGQPDLIELFNPNNVDVNIGGWYLSDDFAAPRKYRIADGTVIPANGFMVFDSATTFNAPLQPNGFGLSSSGDNVCLFACNESGQLNGYYHAFDFGPTLLGMSIGRYVTSQGYSHYVAMSSNTFGFSNSLPKVGPIVISELMIRPPAALSNGIPVDNVLHEFVELQNITDTPQPLYNPDYPLYTWQLDKAVKFTFPQNVTIPPHGCIVVTSFNPATNGTSLAAFQQYYGSNATLFGPYDGQLGNISERVELRMPGTPDITAGTAPSILVDRVDYDLSKGWPQAGIGMGASLQRRTAGAYGNDPTNWTTALPSIGMPSMVQNPPIITQQPQNVSCIENDRVVFNAIHGGDGPFYYQWYMNGQPISSGTSSNLVIARSVYTDQGSYYVQIFSQSGVAVSEAATLSMQTFPIIIGEPQNVSVVPSPTTNTVTTNTIVLSVTVSNTTPGTYQWQLWGTNLPNATNSTLVVSNFSLMQAGPYQVFISNHLGTRASRVANALVLAMPFIYVSPVAQTIPSGGTASFSVVAGPNHPSLPLYYAWKVGSVYVSSNQIPSVVLYNITNSVLVGLDVWNPSGKQFKAVSLTISADSDKDGIPDSVETAWGLSTTNATDALLDTDGDGMSNVNEYKAGTNPTNKLSVLKLDLLSTNTANGEMAFSFTAVSNKTYSVEYLDGGFGTNTGWSNLFSLDSVLTNRSINLTNTLPQGVPVRFYRIRVPRNMY